MTISSGAATNEPKLSTTVWNRVLSLRLWTRVDLYSINSMCISWRNTARFSRHCSQNAHNAHCAVTTISYSRARLVIYTTETENITDCQWFSSSRNDIFITPSGRRRNNYACCIVSHHCDIIWSRDVIGHVTIRLSIDDFLYVPIEIKPASRLAFMKSSLTS